MVPENSCSPNGRSFAKHMAHDWRYELHVVCAHTTNLSRAIMGVASMASCQAITNRRLQWSLGWPLAPLLCHGLASHQGNSAAHMCLHRVQFQVVAQNHWIKNGQVNTRNVGA